MKKIFIILLIVSPVLSYAQIGLSTRSGTLFDDIIVLDYANDTMLFKQKKLMFRNYRVGFANIKKFVIGNDTLVLPNDSIRFLELVMALQSQKVDSLNVLHLPLLLTKRYKKVFQQMRSENKQKFMMGNIDAQRFYEDNHSFALIAIQGALMSSVVSAVTAGVCSAYPPPVLSYLTYRPEMLEDPYYRAGYTCAALKIKRQSLWGGFVTGLSINATTVLYFFVF